LAGRIVAGQTELKPSENAWDWLGHGIYFWEDWITFKSAFVRLNRSSVISCHAEMFDCSTGAGSERAVSRFCQPFQPKKCARPGVVRAKAFAKSHQPAGRASGPLRNFRPHNAPKISQTSDGQASRWPNACPPPTGRRPASHLAVRSQSTRPRGPTSGSSMDKLRVGMARRLRNRALPVPRRALRRWMKSVAREGVISLRFIMGKSSALRPQTLATQPTCQRLPQQPRYKFPLATGAWICFNPNVPTNAYVSLNAPPRPPGRQLRAEIAAITT
jgi:hypothetical protein